MEMDTNVADEDEKKRASSQCYHRPIEDTFKGRASSSPSRQTEHSKLQPITIGNQESRNCKTTINLKGCGNKSQRIEIGAGVDCSDYESFDWDWLVAIQLPAE